MSIFAFGLELSMVDNKIVESSDDIFKQSSIYTHKKLLQCSPHIDLRYKVLSSKKIELIPKSRFKSSTTYNCALNSKFFDVNASFKYTTDSFDMLNFNYFKAENILRVEFNDIIDLKTIKNSVIINKIDKLSKSALDYSISAKDTILLFKINESVGKKFEIIISSKLKNMAGKTIGKEIIKEIHVYKKSRIDIKTNNKIKPMVILDTPQMIAVKNGKFVMRVYFDDTFDEGYNFKNFFEIGGINNYKIDGYGEYLDDDIREDSNISSYYYIDIQSDEFKPNSRYTLKIHKGFSHYKELKEDISFAINSGDMKKEILFDAKKPYVSNVGELGFSSVNVNSASLIIESIPKDNYRYFINYNSADSKNISKYTQEIFSKELTLNSPKNKPIKHKFLIQDLTSNLKNGIYKVTIEYEDKDLDGNILNKSTSKTIFVSDIGIMANIYANGAFISVNSFSFAKPIADAKIDIYSENNILITSGYSDKDGVLKIEEMGIITKNPKVIIVTKDDDKSFLMLDKSLNKATLNSITMIEDKFKAYIYFQSEILRPNSEIKALIVVKDRDFLSADDIPVKAVIRGVDDNQILSKVYHTDKFGLIDFSFFVDGELSTGSYQLSLYFGDKMIGSKVIAIESFIPPQIENRINIDSLTYLSGEFIDAKLESNYLFGAPSSNLKGTLSFNATHKDYTNSKYPNFSFTNNELKDSNDLSYIKQLDNIKLDSKGQAELSISTISSQKSPSILKGLIGLKIMDDTQPVSTYKEVTIYPYSQMVGILLNNNHFEKGKLLEGQTALINPITSEPISRDLTVIIKKVNWHYSLVNGTYQWDKEIEILESFTVKSNTNFSKKVDGYGNYIIEVVDRLGMHSATSEFDIWWWGYASLSPQNSLNDVDVKFEDKKYKKGDTLIATIKSPILDGRAIITLENKDIIWHKSFDITKGVSKIEVPIDRDLGRGAYLHTVVVRKSDTSSSITPYRASSYDFIKSDRDSQKIDINIDLVKTSRSLITQKLDITTDRESALLVSVVDIGILQLVSQDIPKIFNFFSDIPTQLIAYFDLYDKVMSFISKGNFVSFGSDGIFMSLKKKKHLPPKVDRVKPFMLWSNILYTKDKKTSFDIAIPEFNGKARVVVIAVNSDSVGVKTQNLIIKDKIIVKPSYPRFILQGDMLELPIRVFNTTNKTLNVNLSKDISNNIILSIKDKTIELAPNSSKVIYAKLMATESGIGKIKINATTNLETYSKSSEIGIFNPYSLTTINYQDTISKSTTINIPVAFTGSNAIVTLSDNIIGRLRGDLKYLINYPYGCAEQTASKISAMHYSKNYLKSKMIAPSSQKAGAKAPVPSFERKLIKDANRFISKGIKKLSNMQNSSGEFSYWEDGGYINPYASLYASQTLLELDKSGYYVDNTTKNLIISSLQDIAKGNKKAIYNNKHRVYSAYLLSEYATLDKSIANAIYDQKIYDNYYISKYYMSIIFKKLDMKELSDKIYSSISLVDLNTIREFDFKYDGSFKTISRDMAIVFYLKSKYFIKDKKDLNIFKSRLAKLYSTHEKAMALMAITEYMGDKKNQKMKGIISIGDKKIEYKKSITKEIEVNDDKIKITPTSGITNYSIDISTHLPKDIKNSLSDNRPLSIKREFINRESNLIDLNNLKQGDTIYSKITIQNLKKLSNIVVNHRIPACMDIQNDRIAKIKSDEFENINVKITNKDIRDDRVLYFIDLPYLNKTQVNQAVIYTKLNITTKGVCNLPAVTIEAMNDSRINDYALERDIIRVVR
jgi:uncharacterized protein YfaS (alpha-2-macroglobulin family)